MWAEFAAWKGGNYPRTIISYQVSSSISKHTSSRGSRLAETHNEGESEIQGIAPPRCSFYRTLIGEFAMVSELVEQSAKLERMEDVVVMVLEEYSSCAEVWC